MSNLKTGWLSPTGEFVECPYYDHYETAKEIVNKCSAYFCADEDYDYYLEDHGWIGIHLSLFGAREWIISGNIRATPEQIRFLEPYMFDDIKPGLSLESMMEYACL